MNPKKELLWSPWVGLKKFRLEGALLRMLSSWTGEAQRRPAWVFEATVCKP